MNIIDVTWIQMKSMVDSKSLSIQYLDQGNGYELHAFEGPLHLRCYLDKNVNPDDVSDFETNYKSIGNKTLVSKTMVQTSPPFGSKTIVINEVTKNLFARFTGIQSAVTTGSNTITYTMTYAWSKIIGLEVINGSVLDTCCLKVYDNSLGTYSGVPNALLNQFAYSVNIAPNSYKQMAQFDADIYVGMVLEFDYVSINDKTIGINLLINEVKS